MDGLLQGWSGPFVSSSKSVNSTSRLCPALFGKEERVPGKDEG